MFTLGREKDLDGVCPVKQAQAYCFPDPICWQVSEFNFSLMNRPNDV